MRFIANYKSLKDHPPKHGARILVVNSKTLENLAPVTYNHEFITQILQGKQYTHWAHI